MEYAECQPFFFIIMLLPFQTVQGITINYHAIWLKGFKKTEGKKRNSFVGIKEGTVKYKDTNTCKVFQIGTIEIRFKSRLIAM